MSDFTLNRTIIGDCRQTLGTLPEGLFQCCVTSPPYWLLRDYQHPDQIGMEEQPDAYVAALVAVVQRTEWGGQMIMLVITVIACAAVLWVWADLGGL